MKKFIYIIVLIFVSENLLGQDWSQQNWTLLGQVQVYYGSLTKYRSHGEDSYNVHSEMAFLYCSFDGEKMNYKIFVSVDDKSYDVRINTSYTGATVRWSNKGKYITNLPSLSEMYSHKAGPYFFNVDAVRMK